MNKPYIVCYMMTSVDGRAPFSPVFNRIDKGTPLKPLKLISAKTYDSGAVLIRYSTKI